MFFFFVVGVEQQAGRVIKEAAGRCLRCGSAADLVESNKVLKLFFVPVWRWPGKTPAFYCRNCSLISPHGGNGDGDSGVFDRPGGSVPSLAQVLRCHSCARTVDPQFRFCPFCGSSL